jgi:hypothetical protein
MESTQAEEVENVAVQVSVWEDAEGPICKFALLEGEHVEAHQAWEVAVEKFHSLSDTLADGARQLVVSKMEHQEQFKALSLLWAWVLSCVLPLLIHHR